MSRNLMSAEEVAEYRKRRRGCILQLAAGWVMLGIAISLGMWWFRSHSDRDPQSVQNKIAELVQIQVPEGFYPYAYNSMFGVHVATYWHEDHVTEDGRTTSVIAIYWEEDWAQKSVQDVAESVLAELEENLARGDFRTRASRVERFEGKDGPIEIHRYSGLQKMDDGVHEATTCYRFIKGPKGPLQIYTIGLDKSFNAAQQLETLKSAKSRL